MRLRSGWKRSYSGAWRFMRACPLLALMPVVAELAQHAVEARVGLFDGGAATRRAARHPARLGVGTLKLIALVVPQYAIARLLVWGDARRAMQVEPLAARLFGSSALVQLGLSGLGVTAGLGPRWLAAAWMPAGLVAGTLGTPWGVAAALGDRSVGPVQSARLMRGQLSWSIGLGLSTTLPLLVPHYALHALAMRTPARRRALLMADSLLVGAIAAVMGAGAVVVAQRAAARSGTGLGVGGAMPG